MISNVPKMLSFWNYDKNTVNPNVVHKRSRDLVWWICQNKHEWQMSPDNSWQENISCKECTKINKENGVVHPNSLRNFTDHIKNATVYITNKYPEIIKEWDYDKNVVDINNVNYGYSDPVHWKCLQGHEWIQKVSCRCKSKSNTGCLECLIKGKSLFDLYPEIIKEWGDNNLSPKLVLPNSNKKINWECNKGHLWAQSPAQILKITSKGTKCPFCLRNKITYETSLAALFPELMKEWHPDNILKPETVFPGTHKKAKWICLKNKNHIYETMIKNRTRLKDPTGCRYCYYNVSKGETELFDILEIPMECRNQHLKIGKRRFIPDAMISNLKLIIEYNGDIAHGNPQYCSPDEISYFNNKKTNSQIYQDMLDRKNYLESNGWTVVSIWESEWKEIKKNCFNNNAKSVLTI